MQDARWTGVRPRSRTQMIVKMELRFLPRPAPRPGTAFAHPSYVGTTALGLSPTVLERGSA